MSLLRRPMVLLRILALGALLGALSAGPAAATPVAGINIGGPVPQAELDAAVTGAGAKTVRMFAPWNALQPDAPHAFNGGLVAQYESTVARLDQLGAKAVIVLTSAPAWASGSADPNVPPKDPATYAAFAGELAARLARAARPGTILGYEVWNEPEGGEFWAGGADAARYTELLRAAAPALRAADPNAKVVLGPTTGNNYAWVEQLYGLGAAPYFDAVAVHTDTACLDRGPEQFYRDNGRLGQFTFLGYREVRATMAAHGDAAKPIWMTELGWSATTLTCARGQWAGQKPAGVSESDQAAFLKQAFHCMASDPYLEQAIWFNLRDVAPSESELNRYGLQRFDGSHRPAWEAFHSVAARGDTQTGACGDFGGPSIRIIKPTTRLRYSDVLTISASASDPAGLGRITFRADGNPQEIRNFTTNLANDRPVTIDWQGAKRLAYGRHTITVEAVDPSGNVSKQSVQVVRVNPAKLRATLKTAVTTRLRRKGLNATLSGRVTKSGELGLSGKVRAIWQWKAKNGWKKLHGGLKNANKPFTFAQKLKRKGTWRVQVRYVGRAPYKGSASKWTTFRVG